MELFFAGLRFPLSPAIAATVVAAAVVVLLLFLIRSTLDSGRRRRRGQRHPWAGTVFHELLHLSKIHDYHAELATRHGSFRMSHFTRDYVYLVDPACVEHILRTNFSNYGKGSYISEIGHDLFGDGIFAVDGEKWRQQRKLASFEFRARNLRDYGSDVFKRKAVALALVVSEAADSQRALNIYDLLMKSTLDSIFKVAFGINLDTLSGSNVEGRSFSKAFDASSELTMRRYFDIFWKIKRLLNMGAEADLKQHLKVIDEFLYAVIQKKMEQISAQHDASVVAIGREDILSRFLQAQSEPGKEMDIKYLRDIVLNLVVAGRDTTAGTLSWFLYMLCKHPDVQEKVAREVAMATIGADSSASIMGFATALTEEALEKMQYLHAALIETLRLYPAIPVDPKTCFSDDTLPNGFDVREGDLVCYVPYFMGRMKHLWGEDAEEFRPERWVVDEKGTFKPESPFKFTAFQAGPRVCLGKDFAYRQMKIFAVVLVHFFSFQLSDPNKEVTYRSAATLQMDQGLHVRASWRSRILPTTS